MKDSFKLGENIVTEVDNLDLLSDIYDSYVEDYVALHMENSNDNEQIESTYQIILGMVSKINELNLNVFDEESVLPEDLSYILDNLDIFKEGHVTRMYNRYNGE